MPKQWTVLPSIPPETAARHADLHPLVAQLFFNRGFLEDESFELFLHPRYEELLDPFLFQDMHKAVGRIWQALETGGKIVVYGDYDADAVTANAVLQQLFRYLGARAESYIPDRFTEGYGLNIAAFEQLKQQGVTLVITVDCGTNSVDVAEFCKTAGIDLIITDHHEITAATPDSFALVNPKNPGDVYPDHQITGVGVAYKLACALLSEEDKVKAIVERAGRNYIPLWDKWLLDLVAIGTVADCHTLLGENRILVKYGLLVLGKTRWLGLRMLLDMTGFINSNKELNAQALGFVVAPRINAAGRLEHASIALDLLLAEDPAEAQMLAGKLEEINKRRQDITSRLVSEGREMAELQRDRKVLVLAGEDWPKGVVGLVAGRLVEEYRRPVFALSNEGGECAGSARTYGDFDVVECLKAAQEHLVKFGGHKQAAGLTLKTSELEAFKAKVLKFAETVTISVEDILTLDAELSGKDLRVETYDIVSELEPFGAGNPKPKFLLQGATIQSMRGVGTEQQHVQLALSKDGANVECIGFNLMKSCLGMNVGDQVDVACELLADTWNGYRKFKLRIVDIRRAGTFDT